MMPINMQDLKFKILEYVRRYGPCLPVQLSKQINSNILFAGAVFLCSEHLMRFLGHTVTADEVLKGFDQKENSNSLLGWQNVKKNCR